jgi:dTDP-4-dehydrorhamnose reductase
MHLAGLSRPMKIHEKEISKSIELNIIGTANVVRACKMFNVKLIYFSTSYIYPGKKGNYKETDSLLPSSNYAWSKLGGESAVQMYKNSLIIRASMTEKPFVHKQAFANIYTNFIYHEDFVKILKKLINKRGIINVGGPTKSIYNFAKKDNPKIKKVFLKNVKKSLIPINSSMNLNKLKKYL